MSKAKPRTAREKTRVQIQFNNDQRRVFGEITRRLAKKFRCRPNEAVLRALLIVDNMEWKAALDHEEMRQQVREIHAKLDDILTNIL